MFFSVDVTCSGVPTIQWTFMSAAVSRTIGTWQPGVYGNITTDYSSRVQICDNGSMGLSNLRLQDSGFYVITVTDAAGSSKELGFVLKVNGEEIRYTILHTVAYLLSNSSSIKSGFKTVSNIKWPNSWLILGLLCVCCAEVLYEDLQYLSVSALALACLAGLLMLSMWLLDKTYRTIVAWRRRKQMPGKLSCICCMFIITSHNKSVFKNATLLDLENKPKIK